MAQGILHYDMLSGLKAHQLDIRRWKCYVMVVKSSTVLTGMFCVWQAGMTIAGQDAKLPASTSHVHLRSRLHSIIRGLHVVVSDKCIDCLGSCAPVYNQTR